ncbi:MAG: hypothetical protein DRR08_30745 [Candidatus Parabeggiatoa sp. nov. 2]|nr:MAG: hypothetical protein B6247_29135 [Beggiatoa sp. 4572_84]RKZ49845.1 MAG: hypothetical protein DRR08_30745 [Gammaproteobacteria bacterium]
MKKNQPKWLKFNGCVPLVLLKFQSRAINQIKFHNMAPNRQFDKTLVFGESILTKTNLKTWPPKETLKFERQDFVT